MEFPGIESAGSSIADLIQGRRLNAARQSAMQDVQAGNYDSAISKLLGAGDKEGMLAVATIQRSKEMTPAERQAHEDRIMGLKLKYPGAFDDSSAPTAPTVAPTPITGGTTPATPTTPAPTATTFTLPHPRPRNQQEVDENKFSVEQQKAIAIDDAKSRRQVQAKLGTPEQQEMRYQAQSSGLDAMLDTIQKIRDFDKEDSAIPGMSVLDTGTGLMSRVSPFKIGSGYDLQTLQHQLASQTRLTGFQDLRDAAVNGASGFGGRTAVVEFNAIGDKVAAINPGQQKQAYLKQLDKLENWARAAKSGLIKPQGMTETAPSSTEVVAPGVTTVTPTEEAPTQKVKTTTITPGVGADIPKDPGKRTPQQNSQLIAAAREAISEAQKRGYDIRKKVMERLRSEYKMDFNQ